MIDQILGRPSRSLRRFQISVVLFFWIWRLYKGDGAHPPLPGTRTSTAYSPLKSAGVGAGGAAGAGFSAAARRKRTWLWRLWVIIAGRSRTTIGWMGKINDRLSTCTMDDAYWGKRGKGADGQNILRRISSFWGQ